MRFDVTTTIGGTDALERAELGDGDRVVGEDLEQERLELVVGPVDLVDEQHRWRDAPERFGFVADRPQQRPPHEEALRVELVFDDLTAARFDRPQVQQLARVVPLVDGLRGIDALVALEPNELAARPARQHLGHFGLADARLAFEEQRAVQAHRQEDRGRQAVIGEIVVLRERGAHVVNRFHHGDPSLREPSARNQGWMMTLIAPAARLPAVWNASAASSRPKRCVTSTSAIIGFAASTSTASSNSRRPLRRP